MTNTKSVTATKEKSDLEVRAKFFETKDSLLTELCKDKDKAAVAQIGIAVILGYLGHIAIGDIFYNTGNKFGFKLISVSFPNVGLLILSWSIVLLSSLISFFALQVWGRLRIYLTPKSMYLKLFDSVSILSFVCCWLGVFIFTAYMSLTGYVSNLCTVTFVTETFRMFAKTYACVRDTVPKILKNKLKSEEGTYFPTFSNFLYFLFVPTLVYNDSYPRLKAPIKWGLVVEWLLHILVVVITFSCIVDINLISELQNHKILHLMDIIALTFKFHFIVLIFIIFTFYVALHCIQNLFAEILRFPYRVFYADWWCSKNYIEFFYKWNVLVRDWFYVYVYHDVYKNLTNNNKFLAKYAVFLSSAVFHETVTCLTAGYCLPIVFLEYFVLVGIVSFVKIKNYRWANVFFWFSVSMGIVVVLITHALESFARMKCPIENETVSTFFTPRMFSCFR